jgi:hypothetical protein
MRGGGERAERERWRWHAGWAAAGALLAALAGPAALRAASPSPTPAPALALVELELVFQNGRPDVTVPRNFPGLRVHARAGFHGSGLFDAFWVVDGRILAPVTEPVMFGEVLLFSSPRQPALPTFEPGLHTVTLQVRSPRVAGRLPSISYFVTADEFAPPAPGGRP